MIEILALIISCTFFAYVIQNRTRFYPNAREGIQRDIQSRIVYYGILIAFTMFAGLRSRYNDTLTYIHSFILTDVNDLSVMTLFESYGGFTLYQQVLKKYISKDPQVFIFVSSVITNIIPLKFYTRYTSKYSEMIFLYAIGNFVFGMAGIKQAIAMAISLYAIEHSINKRYCRAILLLLLAMTFHPYILCLICVPVLTKRIWDIRTVLVILISVIAFMNLDKVFALLSYIGKDYSNDVFDDYTINPIRVLVESVPVVISFMYRKRLNNEASKMVILGINMRIISFVFIAMGLFANPIYFGRMSTYFTALSVVAIPEMLSISWKSHKNWKVYRAGYYIFFFIYFLMDITKIGSISIFADLFKHVPLFSLFN